MRIHLIVICMLLTSMVMNGQEATEETLEKESGYGFKDLRDNVPEFIKNGKFNLNVRPRYEFADIDGPTPDPDESNAFTVRTAIGFETAPIYGFRAMIEAEDVTIIGNEDNYNQAGLSGAGRTVIADVEGTELNQAWLGYEKWDTMIKAGRQNLVLDDARFIGNVAWRQNFQTYDGITLKNTSFENLTLFYGYLYNVNRIFGEDHPAGDWDSESHLFDVSYSGIPWGTLTAFTYLLDFEEDAPVLSGDTYGLKFVGAQDLTEKWKGTYRVEYAHQENLNTQDADYYLAELGTSYDRFNAGVGYNILGSGEGDLGPGFATPLATLHKFNGWADRFLATPMDGLHDMYVWGGVNLPGKIPFKLIYHDFSADTGGMDYGYEINALATRKFGKHWGALAKYAYHDGEEGNIDIQRFWFQVSFDY